MKSQLAIACLGVVSLLGCQVKLHQISDAGFAVSAAGTAAIGPDAGRLCAQNHACVFDEHWDATTCQCARDPQAGAGGNAGESAAGSAGDASTGCADIQLCVRGDHWDTMKCQCVSNAAGAGGASGTGGTSAAGKSGGSGDSGAGGRAHAGSGGAGHAGGSATGASGQGDAGGAGLACGPETCTSAQVCCLESAATAGTCALRCDSACPAPCTPPVVDAGTGTDAGCKTALDCHGGLPQLCRLCTDYSTDPSAGNGCAHWTCKSSVCQIAYCN